VVAATGRRVSLPVLAAVLLVLSAALFSAGVVVEHSGGDTHAAVAPSGTGGRTETGQEGSESHEQTEPAGQAAATEAGSERVLGASVESPGTVVAVVVVSLLLAGLVWWYRRSWVLVAVAVFAAGAAVFDIAEVVHQVRAGRVGVGGLAVLVAALHVAVVVAVAAMLRPAVRVARR
jgi:hypothetical protein